jgi:hypothetical protein
MDYYSCRSENPQQLLIEQSYCYSTLPFFSRKNTTVPTVNTSTSERIYNHQSGTPALILRNKRAARPDKLRVQGAERRDEPMHTQDLPLSFIAADLVHQPRYDLKGGCQHV